MPSSGQLEALRRRLGEHYPAGIPALIPLPDTGLAHDHVRIGDSGRLLRIPKQSQLALDADANLDYQAACFRRCAPSGHTPRLHTVLPPGDDLPMGALLVDYIDGRPLRLPDDLDALAEALAALHGLPLLPPEQRPPLLNPHAPLIAMCEEIGRQAAFLPQAGLDPTAQERIEHELALARRDATDSAAPPVTLISFDAHPGNFLVDASGHAWLVDLEKARYSLPGFDLAHASLYTSTTWDVASHAVLDEAQLLVFHQRWLAAMPADLANAVRPWLLPARRLMWLWSVSWCAKWRVQSGQAARAGKPRGDSAEDWSAELSDAALIAHVADRVADYLHPETIEQVRRDWRPRGELARLCY